MKRLAVTLLLIAVLVCAVACTPHVESMDNMIGTVISLSIRGKDARHAEKDIYAMIDEVDKSVSTRLDTSIVSRINGAEVGESITLDDTTNELIALSYDYYERTEGAFDISVFPLVDAWQFSPEKIDTNSKEPPSDEAIASAKALVGLDRAFTYDSARRTIVKNIEGAMLDLGALAKGYIVDRAREILDGYEIESAIIDIGRDLYLYGDRTYRVGISHPRPALGEDIIEIIECENTSVGTSGDYERYYLDSVTGERYHHIIDPHTGRPAKAGLISVTIVGESALLGDILSTSVFVMGEEKGRALLSTISEVESAIFVSENASGELAVTQYQRA